MQQHDIGYDRITNEITNKYNMLIIILVNNHGVINKYVL